MTRLPLRFAPRPVRTLADRMRRSPLVRDIEHNGGWLALWCAFILVAALLVGLLTSHWVVTWDVVYNIDDLPCGDYCGGDAGLITEPADAP